MEDFNDDDISIFVGKFETENQNSVVDSIMNQKQSQGSSCNNILKNLEIIILQQAIRTKEELNKQIIPILKYLQNKNLQYGDLEKQNQELIILQEQSKQDIQQLQDQISERNQKNDELMDQISQLEDDMEKLKMQQKYLESQQQNKLLQNYQSQGESQWFQQTQIITIQQQLQDKEELLKKIEKDLEEMEKSKKKVDQQNKDIQNQLDLITQRNKNLMKELERYKPEVTDNSKKQTMTRNKTLGAFNTRDIIQKQRLQNDLTSQKKLEQIKNQEIDNANNSDNQEEIDTQSKTTLKQDSEQAQASVVNSQIIMEKEQKIVELEKIKIELEQKITELECEINGIKSNNKKVTFQITKLEKAVAFEKEQNTKLREEKATMEQDMKAEIEMRKKENIGLKRMSVKINQNDVGASLINADELNLKEKFFQLSRDLQATKQQNEMQIETYEKQITQLKTQIEIYAKNNLEKENQVLELQKNLQLALEEKENQKSQIEKLADSKNFDGESTLKESCCKKLKQKLKQKTFNYKNNIRINQQKQSTLQKLIIKRTFRLINNYNSRFSWLKS
ncbi:unnamed protein product (macronuclear) [Paramecium tetraurelia]|uniref:Uncharacterized protein n=1 Tax=Paramecium tetraurelia TaxID=5888 RepID=A0DBE1_PARTE|nr:uncharacterized protein GSPATT00015253001 [Paramecium tetraurelia]CAK80358.1 unnamed protein product [Paramecium tetraurelia]|eukprot:XP_001447755.1 hypothetical protein (macronuclear) [Paramecium tetraurelia strain d4-2]